jgi:hypothetical protein
MHFLVVPALRVRRVFIRVFLLEVTEAFLAQSMEGEVLLLFYAEFLTQTRAVRHDGGDFRHYF